MENRTLNEQVDETTTEKTTTSDQSPKPKQRGSKKLLLGGILAALLLGGGVFAYQSTVLNSPDNVWKRSMENSARGLKEFSAVDKLTSGGANFKGSLNVDKPTGVSAAFEGKTKDLNSSSMGTLSVAGAKVDFNVNTLKADGSDFPDIYFKVKGLASIPQLSAAGPQVLTQLEDKWFFVDHTLLAQGAQQTLNESSQAAQAKSVTMSEQDIKNIREKFADVFSQYVFTVDESKSIVKRVGEPVQEDFEGRASVKFMVEPQKENLKAFLSALKQAVKETKLKDLIEANGGTVDDILKLDDTFKSIDNIKLEDSHAEVWADKNMKYIRNIRLTDSVDEGNGTRALNIGLNYTGGDEYPFYVKLDGVDHDKSTIKLSLTDSINKLNGKMSLSTDFDMGGVQGIKGNFKLETTPSTEEVKPEKPSGARNIMEIFNQFTGGSSATLTGGEQTLLDDLQAN